MHGIAVAVGDTVAGYRVEAVAGAGGMGVVYRAAEAGLERSVALKVILPELAREPGFRELFIRESTTAAALEHPNVIPVYRAGEDAGHLFIAMRFVEGESLGLLIARSGRLPPGRAARLVAQVADALDAAHERGLVHRDVKPANVMIADPDGEEHAYLTDFGLSIRGAEGLAATPGRWAGTPGYLAPEQIAGRPIDRRTDVYALGCTLFRALTGRAPFSAPDDAGVLTAHLTDPPPRVSDVAPGVPRGFDEVVRRALAKRPDDRYATAGELGRAALAVRYDVYLCHAPGDAPAAEAIAATLDAEGLEPWLAARCAVPGGEASREALEGLRAAGACAVLVGPGGLGDWARDELAAAREIAARERGFRLVAVLLPGAPEPFDPSLAILAAAPWVDLRAGLGDPDGLRDLTRAVRGELRLGPPLALLDGDDCPYRGLEPFGEDQSELFFGREEETVSAVERLRGARFLAVLGPSGGGKSSLLRAGVVPALRRGALPGSEAWDVAIFSPGARPLEALAAQVREPGGTPLSADELMASEQALDRAAGRLLAGHPASARLVLLVDQFEEVFTLCPDDAERTAFLRNLRYAATIPAGRVVLLLSLRADFYQRCAEDPELRTLVSAQQILLGPLDAEGLRRAVEEPARLAGLELEPGLARRILGDVAERPGALPLLEYLLLELWHRRRGRTLTLEAYAASGGVEGALAKRANAVYAGLDADGRRIARRLLLRLTQPGEGTEDTRRRASVDELVSGPAEAEEVHAVIQALAEARLLSVGHDEASGETVVEITHEALLRGWPELRRWINDARERLRLERRLTDAARDWDQGGREEGLLYRGARLGAWQERDLTGLSPLERDFLVASREAAARERAAGRRRLRLGIAGLAVALAAITAVAVLAIVRGNEAADARDLARSRQIAGSADGRLTSDPELALLLAQQAYRVRPTVQSEEVLRQATYDSRVRAAVHGSTQVNDAALAPDGRLAVAEADGSVRVWDPRTRRLLTLGHHAGGAFSVAFSPDGRELASAGADDTVRVWDVARRTQLAARHGAGVGDGFLADVAFSRDGRSIVAGGATEGVLRVYARNGRRVLGTPKWSAGDVLVWPWRSGGRPTDLPAPRSVLSVAFSGDGRRVVLGDRNGDVRVWPWRAGSAPALIGAPGAGPAAPVQSVAFLPGGRGVLSADGSGRIRRWRLGGGSAPLIPAGRPGRGFTVDVAPDGRHVVSVGDNGAVVVWDMRGIDPPTTLRGHSGVVDSAGFGPGGRQVVTGGSDGSARVWDWRAGEVPVMLASGGRPYLSVELTADGRRVLGQDDRGRVRAWDLSSGRESAVLGTLGRQGILAAAISPDGRVAVSGDVTGQVSVRRGDEGSAAALNVGAVNAVAAGAAGRIVASGGQDGTVQVWDWAAASKPVTLSGNGGAVNGVAISPDGTRVAGAGQDGTVRVWDWASAGGGRPVVLRGHQGAVDAVAFSPDGTRVASGGQDGTVRVWDWGSAGAQRPVVLRGHQGAVDAVAFSPDGTRVVSGGQDATVRVWDWTRDVQLLVLHAHRGGVASVAIGREARRIVSSGQDGSVRLWRCDVCGPIRDVLALAPKRVTRQLTPAERRVYLG